MTENPKLHRFFTVQYKGTIYYRFDTYGPEYTVWMKVDKADQVDNVDVYNFLETAYKRTDLDIIKECRQTGKTRTTTKNLLEKAYYEQMTKEIDISKVLIEGDTATIMGEKYKRVEEPKSPVEEAYKRWMGEYPPTTPSVDSTDDIRWRAYQMGYNASKVSETPQEPEELKTLYQMWNDGECRDDICYLVKSWMSQYEIDRWCDDWDVGFSDCLDKLNKGLK